MDILKYDLEEIAQNKPLFQPLENKTLLITGATGLIGSLLIKSILQYNETTPRKIKVIGIARSLDKVNRIFKNYVYPTCQLQFMIQNIVDTIHMDEEVDYIVHTASITDSKQFVEFPVETIKTTVNGCENLLHFGYQKKVQGFLYLSTLEVYGFPFEKNEISYLDEKTFGSLDPCLSRSSYPEGKRLAECLCISYMEEYGLPVKIIRLSQTFGPGVLYNDNRVFAEFSRCLLEQRDIILRSQGNTVRNYCYTMDEIRAMLTVLIHGVKGEVYNVANKNTTASIYDMAKLICSLSQDSIGIKFELDNKNYGYNPEMKVALNTEKIEKLGWAPQYNLPEMFQRLIQDMSFNK